MHIIIEAEEAASAINRVEEAWLLIFIFMVLCGEPYTAQETRMK